MDRRPRVGRVGARSHPGRRAHPARLPRVSRRGRRAGSKGARCPLLRRRQPLGLRRKDARRARLRVGSLARRRVHRLEAKRRRRDDTAHALAREARALLAPHPDPGDRRRGGAAQAARFAHPLDRRGRARLAGRALPRGRRCRDDRDRRRGHRRRDEPAAPDRALARHARHAEGRQREARDRGAQPGRRRAHLPGAPHLREHRPDPRRRLGHRSSTAPTTSRRATSSTTRRCGAASPSCTARSTASRAR